MAMFGTSPDTAPDTPTRERANRLYKRLRVPLKKEDLITWLIFLPFCAWITFQIFKPLPIEIKPVIPHHDFRVSKLAIFFNSKKCPRPFYIQEYLHVADKYGLPYTLLPAIAFREQTCWRVPNTALNEFGVGSASHLHVYKSIPEGMIEAAKILIDPKKGLTRYGPNHDLYPLEIQAIEKQIL